MADRTFAEYKQDMRDFVIQYAKERRGTPEPGHKTTNEMNIREIADGLKRTFPKEPIPGDRLAICYAYAHLSMLPMPDEDYREWRRHIKAFVGDLPAEKAENDGNLFFMLQSLSLSRGEAAEDYRCTDKILKKMTAQTRNHPKVAALAGQLVRPYYEQLVERAGRAENFSAYVQQIKAFDKAIGVLPLLAPGSRYHAAQKLLNKMEPVYKESEWGRQEWERKCSSVRRKVFKSLPVDAKQAIRARRAREEWLYK